MHHSPAGKVIAVAKTGLERLKHINRQSFLVGLRCCANNHGRTIGKMCRPNTRIRAVDGVTNFTVALSARGSGWKKDVTAKICIFVAPDRRQQHLVNHFQLTYMATIHQLCEAGLLISLGGGLDVNEQPRRLLYALPHVVEWLDQVLPGLDADFHEGKQDPIEQADDMFHDFVSGDNFSFWHRSHSMHPTDPGVWELKTPDLRLFGWFAAKGVFIIAEINTAFLCKQHRLYPGYRGSVVRRRDALDLDEPKFITGEYEDVL